ncbi:putative cytochrome p450 protein [Phaeoacremonium minimum UCRPA7]|uniref:Putative cytochrome p450 protein n=1 Tax=Phaeoacremonium minimum (strain UCR-PA7) TaxID=1286976 RepID=R8BLT3_PHAM7|nr:putative cytochrome p450 protein [Phaeoacremonium minimum UCRPA7]EOO00297.1 putative cytochrome p450 protein [Phaeoacremonium minimum UCRPA7]
MGAASLATASVVGAVLFYSKLSGSSYPSLLLYLGAASLAEIAVYVVYHSLNTPFVLGNLVPFLAEPWGFPLARWQKAIPTTKSGFYRVFLGPFDYLIPKSSQAVTAVMSQPYVFEKPAAVRDGLVVSLGVGLVAAEGDQHRKQKKLLTPIFGLSRNRRLVPQMWAKAQVFGQKLEEMVKEAGGPTVILVHPLTMAATLDVIGSTTLGTDFDSIRYPDQPILQAYQKVFPSLENQNAFERFVGATLPAIISPHVLFKVPLRPIREFHQGMAMLKEYCTNQIRLKKKEIDAGGADDVELREKDILSAIIASGLTDENELLSHLLTILAAGHESTAITLAWALFKLAQNQDVQEKLRAEIRESLPHMASEVPTLDEINGMKYLRCFLMEVFRLYPAFPSMMREAARPTTVGDLQIPKGKHIMVSPYAVNRSPELWGNDADEFRVERWEESYNGGAKTSQAFLTFSSGPRICIGKDFATISLKGITLQSRKALR